MTVHYLRITPEGMVTPFDSTGGMHADAVARAEFEGDVEVVTLHESVTVPDLLGPLVGWVHGTGLYQRHPVNRKGWALYGRSPIVGVIYVALDSRGPLPPVFVDLVSSDHFPPLAVLTAMRNWLRDHDQAGDYVWPVTS